MNKRTYPNRRYKFTLELIQKYIPKDKKILDLGVENAFTHILRKNGYTVFNTHGEDLDLQPEIVKEFDVDVVIALEILEHLLSPFNVLRNIKSKELITTVPLGLWFASAYRNKNDEWDRHYHEFEDWQYDWLLEKSGWEIIHREKWTSPIKKAGFRPILRVFTPRYYATYAINKK